MGTAQRILDAKNKVFRVPMSVDSSIRTTGALLHTPACIVYRHLATTAYQALDIEFRVW